MHGGGSPDEQQMAAGSAVVAIDRDKNSQLAVKWAMDYLLAGTSDIVLLHVSNRRILNHGFAMAETTLGALEAEMKELFLPYKGFCARKGVQMTEVVLEETDVSKAIIDYITANKIQSIALGASNRNAFTKKFRNPDVPTNLMKAAPDFCNIYVIAKGKPVAVRLAKCTAHKPGAEDPDALRGAGGPLMKRSFRAMLPPATPDRRSVDSRNIPELTTRPPFRERSLPAAVKSTAVATKLAVAAAPDSGDGSSHRSSRRSVSRDSFAEDLDLVESMRFSSMDFADSLELGSLAGSPRAPNSPNAGSQREVESEMRRLRLELKQTMDMYNAACKEAITAKQKAKELHQWKLEEARRFEEARHAEEAALALAEMEKAKCKAAMEAAEAARKIAELEAQRRHNAEVRARREAEEKVKALDAMAHHDIRYRKYHIDDIEIATEHFSESLKIGEGGYGPVYRACLDHTPVAIKVLRPDAQQGRKQFQQEVEVLSCIRHPNMVLLLGACPEYGCLVYEYMDNGSLDDRLFRRGGTPPIPWSVRFKIAAEIATALLFLHQAKPEPLVHRDLKPANILLDRNYVSKISDVGLARLVPPLVADSVTQYRMTATAGTFCYIDPEYQQTGMLGIKSDIYSLGVMLLQIVTARPPMGLTHHVENAVEKGTFEQMLDTTVKDWPVEEVLGYANLALKCTELRRKDRPDLATVILPELNRLRNLGHAYEASMSGSSATGTFDSASHSSGSRGHSSEKATTMSSPSLGTAWKSDES